MSEYDETTPAQLELVPALDYGDYGPAESDEPSEAAPRIQATYFEAKPYLAIDAYLEAGTLNLIVSLDEALFLRDAIDSALTNAFGD
jgi:hypothetical protein